MSKFKRGAKVICTKVFCNRDPRTGLVDPSIKMDLPTKYRDWGLEEFKKSFDFLGGHIVPCKNGKKYGLLVNRTEEDKIFYRDFDPHDYLLCLDHGLDYGKIYTIKNVIKCPGCDSIKIDVGLELPSQVGWNTERGILCGLKCGKCEKHFSSTKVWWLNPSIFDIWDDGTYTIIVNDKKVKMKKPNADKPKLGTTNPPLRAGIKPVK